MVKVMKEREQGQRVEGRVTGGYVLEREVSKSKWMKDEAQKTKWRGVKMICAVIGKEAC